MPKITIDGREIEVTEGTTVLQAARTLGIDIPTLCYFTGYKPSTSCLCCMVKVKGLGRLVPSCGTVAVDGMEIESETGEVHDVRRTALELLLSDHLGDCYAPCDFACPAHMDIPLMLRQIHGEELKDAIVTVKNDIALPAILGRICPKPCEKICRRGGGDGPVAICKLKRYVADVDLATGNPHLPDCKPDSGRSVAVIGGGPSGLAAVYYLRQKGHAVVLHDNRPELGGRIWDESSEAEMPRDILSAEIATITRLGVDVHLKSTVGESVSLEELRSEHDAVFIACGATHKETFDAWGVKAMPRGAVVDKETYQTNLDGVFAGGNAIRTKGMVVRSVADGKEAAAAMDQFLTELPVLGPGGRFSSRISGKLKKDELAEFMGLAPKTPLRQPEVETDGYSIAESIEQSSRCLHCDCRALDTCKLKKYSDMYGADTNRYKGERAQFHQDIRHSDVLYEPGKCINCGLCVEIAAMAGEPIGLTFVGRGFDVRVGVPLDFSIEEALGKVADKVVEACPTAALAWQRQSVKTGLPILGQS